MIFRALSRLIILVIGVVVLAELVGKDDAKKDESTDESDDADAQADGDKAKAEQAADDEEKADE